MDIEIGYVGGGHAYNPKREVKAAHPHVSKYSEIRRDANTAAMALQELVWTLPNNPEYADIRKMANDLKEKLDEI